MAQRKEKKRERWYLLQDAKRSSCRGRIWGPASTLRHPQTPSDTPGI